MSAGEDKSVAQVLREAKAKIAERGAWTKGRYGSTRDDSWAAPTGYTATCWCALGALIAVGEDVSKRSDTRAEGFLRRAIPAEYLAAICETRRTVSAYNDLPSTTHADIMALYDRAIALAESEAA